MTDMFIGSAPSVRSNNVNRTNWLHFLGILAGLQGNSSLLKFYRKFTQVDLK